MIWQPINAHTHKHIQINHNIIYVFVYIHKCTCTTSYLLARPLCLWFLLKLHILIMCVELSMDPLFFWMLLHQTLWAWNCRYFFLFQGNAIYDIWLQGERGCSWRTIAISSFSIKWIHVCYYVGGFFLKFEFSNDS